MISNKSRDFYKISYHDFYQKNSKKISFASLESIKNHSETIGSKKNVININNQYEEEYVFTNIYDYITTTSDVLKNIKSDFITFFYNNIYNNIKQDFLHP